MKRQDRLSSAKDTQLDNRINEAVNREFQLPPRVEEAKQRAYERIRSSCMEQTEQPGPERRHGCFRSGKLTIGRMAAGFSAAAAVFGVVCISNPALAAQIPLIGHVFEELGSSLEFSGDYENYSASLSSETEADAATDSSQTQGEAAPANGYSQTVGGVTVTLSEVYCNDAALYLSMLIETEEPFPDTFIGQDGAPSISLWNSSFAASFNPEKQVLNEYLDGRMVDDHTYAGVLRLDLDMMNYSFDDTYYEAQNDFFETLGVTSEELEEHPQEANDKLEELLGVELLSPDVIAAAGGPDYQEYETVYEIPDSFTLNLTIQSIVGSLADGREPEMPQELLDEYHAAMAENGLDEADYENFTEEEKEIELRLFQEMHNKYAELYPETTQYPNQYSNWWYDGEWTFEVPVSKNTEDTIVKEIQDTDENGLGIASVTLTPVEITVESILPVPAYDYFTVVLDADGEPFSGGFGTALAVQDRDVSKIDIYICDYIEYMDELKGYYWSNSYEEDQKKKSFKELLDERALYHTEVVF